MRDSSSTLAELARDVTLYPQQLINVKVPKGFDSRDNVALKRSGGSRAGLERQRPRFAAGVRYRTADTGNGGGPISQKVNHWAEKIADVVRSAAAG